MLQWPWRRFDAMYASFKRSQIIESLEQRRDATIAALWANMNYDGGEEDEESPRAGAIKEIEANCKEAIEYVWMVSEGKDPEADQPTEFVTELDYENNPFFSAAKRGAEEVMQPVNTNGSVSDAVKEQYEHLKVDQ